MDITLKNFQKLSIDIGHRNKRGSMTVGYYWSTISDHVFAWYASFKVLVKNIVDLTLSTPPRALWKGLKGFKHGSEIAVYW